jgi:hypothetical protein
VGDGFSFGKVTFPDGALLEDVSVSGFQRDPNQPLPFSCLGLLSTVGVTGAVAAAAATGVFDDDLPPRAAALASDVGAICFAACVSFSGCRLDPNHPVFFGAATSGFPGAFAALDADASRCCGVSGAGLLADAAGFPDTRRDENHPRFLLGAGSGAEAPASAGLGSFATGGIGPAGPDGLSPASDCTGAIPLGASGCLAVASESLGTVGSFCAALRGDRPSTGPRGVS